MPGGPARQYCQELIQLLETAKRVDLTAPPQSAEPQFSTDYLFGRARGQMFGILLCRTQTGQPGILRAFSGQYNGAWLVNGWVPPLLDVDEFQQLTCNTEQEIKALGREIDQLAQDSKRLGALRRQRKTLSQRLMKEIHALYRLTNFRGETRSLAEVFINRSKGMPTGTADCCAPKLLNYAAVHQLVPLGLAEFYWGLANPSTSRGHGIFYPACRDKCHPILGFLLCGLPAR